MGWLTIWLWLWTGYGLFRWPMRSNTWALPTSPSTAWGPDSAHGQMFPVVCTDHPAPHTLPLHSSEWSALHQLWAGLCVLGSGETRHPQRAGPCRGTACGPPCCPRGPGLGRLGKLCSSGHRQLQTGGLRPDLGQHSPHQVSGLRARAASEHEAQPSSTHAPVALFWGTPDDGGDLTHHTQVMS